MSDKIQVWRMFEGVHLFPPHEIGSLDDEQHLAEIVSLLGPPPAEFLIRSPNCFKFWDEKGEFQLAICFYILSSEISDICAKEYGKA